MCSVLIKILFSHIRKCSFCIKNVVFTDLEPCTKVLLEGSAHPYKKKTTHTPPSYYKKKLHTLHPRNSEGKREEIERFAAIKEKLENPFGINKCITVLEGLSDIPIKKMLKAANIFKDSPSNREVSLSFSSNRALNASAWRPISCPSHHAPAIRHTHPPRLPTQLASQTSNSTRTPRGGRRESVEKRAHAEKC